MSDGDELAEEEVYDFVAADDSDASVTDDESLASALKLLQPPSSGAERGDPRASDSQPLAGAGQAPARVEEEAGDSGGAEVPEDYVRNFLRTAGLQRTAEAFETEWYELQAQGQLTLEGTGAVPDAYARVQELEDVIKALRVELGDVRKAAALATGDWDRLRKARDFHRLHHKRVAQEKDKLLADMKRLRMHYAQYEPVIRDLRAKYEATTREATRVRLERDRLAQQLALAEEQAGSRGGGAEEAQPEEPRVQRVARTTSDAARSLPSGGSDSARGAAGPAAAPAAPAAPSGPRSAGVPTGRLPNPYRDVVFEPARVAQYVQRACMVSSTGEDGSAVATSSVAAVAVHPTKPVCATGCDDTTWGLWALPGGERLMCGEGHDQWVSTIAFHPGGGQLASGSGDGTVKLWSLGQRKCVATLGGESKGAAVWSVAYHDGGATLAAACLDKHARLWDLATGKCILTLRGHGDSVNDVAWQPFGSGIATAGSDRSLIVWDTRTGLPSLTLSGHTSGVHSLAWALAADVLVSCDGDGMLRLWDVRTGGALGACSTGTAALNRVAFERSGALLAAGSDDGSVKCVAVAPGTATPLRVEATLKGHTEAVQAVAWDPKGEFLLSGSSDGTLRLWGVPPPPPPPPSRSGTAMSHRSAMPVA